MNSKESQNALETMLAQSLANRLTEMGADAKKAENAVAQMDFIALRAHLGRTPEELKTQLAALFA